MKPKKDPIKPSKTLSKKPNFKKEKLDTDYFCKLPVFRSPGVFIREIDTTSIELQTSDIEYLQRMMMESSRIPSQFINPDSEIVSPQEIRTHQEFQRLFGSPIGISSRSRQTPDGDIELLGYDLVATPSVPSAVLGGEEMMYNASTWMTLNKKKTRWEKLKGWFSNIYKKWKRAE
jgi:hypothetical protein